MYIQIIHGHSIVFKLFFNEILDTYVLFMITYNLLCNCLLIYVKYRVKCCQCQRVDTKSLCHQKVNLMRGVTLKLLTYIRGHTSERN